jgi:molecular chaperone GrpE
MTDRLGIRRHRAQERIDALDTSPDALAAAADELRREGGASAGAHAGARGPKTGEADTRTAAELAEALTTAEAERDEFRTALQRERAEFTNFRQRTTRERDQERGLAGVDLIAQVLSLADDFDRAIETRPDELADSGWADGIANIDRKLRNLLDTEGVTAVDAAVGTPFDPALHEAITSVPGTGLPDGVIAAEVRRGYRLRDRLIRPTLVAVASGAEADAEPAGQPD